MLLDQNTDMTQYADSLASRLGCTAADVLAMAATLEPARQICESDLASERRAQDARMTRAERATHLHEED